jgi:hypothetical protein
MRCEKSVVTVQTYLDRNEARQLLLSHESESDWLQTPYRNVQITFPFALPGVDGSELQQEGNLPHQDPYPTPDPATIHVELIFALILSFHVTSPHYLPPPCSSPPTP